MTGKRESNISKIDKDMRNGQSFAKATAELVTRQTVDRARMTAAAAWRPVATGTADPQTWGTLRMPVSAAYHTGTLRTVEFRRSDDPHQALIIYVYPYWEGDHFRSWSVGLSSELVTGRDPADPVRTFIWSSCRDRKLPPQYPGLGQADDVAGHIIRLVAAADGFTAINRAYPGVMAWLMDRDALA